MSTAVIAVLLAPVSAALSAELPRVELEESNRYLSLAYDKLLERDYIGSLQFLDRALQKNTYLGDYYLMRGIAMSRLGYYDLGCEALRYYLEVRPADQPAARILANIDYVRKGIAAFVNERSLGLQRSVTESTPQDFFALGALRPFSPHGLGKADSLGPALCLADTMGNALYYRTGRGSFSFISCDRPVAPMLTGLNSAYIFAASGGVCSLDCVTGAIQPLGSLDGAISDAVRISHAYFAAADPVEREVSVYESVSLKKVSSWRPPQDKMLFEPCALAVYGTWLAVADRANGRVFCLDTHDAGKFFSFEVPAPRDVLWSPLGELYVVAEGGELFVADVDFQARRVEAVRSLSSDLRDGWTLFAAPGGDVVCLSITAARLWRASLLPNEHLSFGILGLSSPAVVRDGDNERFALVASFATPFLPYAMKSQPVVHAVWNDRMITSAAVWQDIDKHGDVLLFYNKNKGPGSLPPFMKPIAVRNAANLRAALPAAWSGSKDTLSNVVIDSDIPLTAEDLEVLVSFCMTNGLAFDIWLRGAPSASTLRGSALCGGSVLLSLADPITPSAGRLQIAVPLPSELSSSGYPGRSMLSVYMDTGVVQVKDWLPLWPDRLRSKR